MRPRRLSIKGFGCFSDPVEIDFTPMDVFVISGPTGAGKTTIIDAICYALYGKTPRGAQGQALLAHNRDEMAVTLEFEAANEQYRVHRSFNVTRKTGKDGNEKVTPALSPKQLEHLDGGDWDPLGDRVKNIDEEIERIVGLDFDGFTRCVLLPQGQFAEFLSGDKAKRRTILVDLLDVGVYQRLMARANKRADQLEAEAKGHDNTIKEFGDATRERLEAVRAEIAETGPKLVRAKSERDALAEAQRLADVVKSARLREKASGEEHARNSAEAKAEEEAAAEGQAIEREMESALKQKESALSEVDYDAARYQALGIAMERAKGMERSAADAARSAEAAASTAKVDAAEKAANAADEKHAAARAALEAAEAALDAAQRADAAAHVQRGLKPGDPCPVCGGVVEKLPKITAKSGLGVAEKARESARSAEDKASKAAADAAKALALARAQHAQDIEAAAKAAADLENARGKLAEVLPPGIDADVNSITVAHEAQKRAAAAVESLTQEIKKHRDALDAHKKRIAESAAAIARLRAEAAAALKAQELARAEADTAMGSLRALVEQWDWASIRAVIEARRFPGDQIKDLRDAATTACDALTKTVAELEASANKIAEGIERVGAIRAKAEQVRKQAQLYHQLGVLLKADNFQDFVISEAMRVLAETATAHLRTLSPRYAIAIERNEFMVEDAWQAGRRRSAKTLSGGETFIASLALALALSQRLPELRSATAATLESLFLDEGFGTLDRDSLSTVMEALEGLRSEERMVGIITHVPELSQRIETRIEVRPAPTGSTIEVVGA